MCVYNIMFNLKLTKMKKIYLTLCMAMIAVFAFAGGVKVSKGKATFMKSECKIAVVFDWSNAKWNEQQPVKEQWKDEYDAYVENGEAQFIEGFNKKSKKAQIVKEDSSADYLMTIKFSNFDKFYSMMSVVPGNKHKIWGEITVTDKKTGDVICTYNVKEFKGGRDFSIFDSFKESMRDLGSELAETK